MEHTYIVKFNSPDEYLEELKKSDPEGGIVRLTYLKKESVTSPNIRHNWVLSTFVTGAQIVRLDTFLGDTWPDPAGVNEKVEKRGQEIVSRIEAFCKELGYEVRAGVFEPAGNIN